MHVKEADGRLRVQALIPAMFSLPPRRRRPPAAYLGEQSSILTPTSVCAVFSLLAHRERFYLDVMYEYIA
ncbi:hypothetical protein Pmi06nite_78060 [Planotetraspora mira]|uniref:Uncharacterized protein n=1 Tax=Planotetraspora mira TaxID=58121 RepID=A0A8J3U1K9_9ACTN|nr:hypothetical protein Pmi06nite_78060 [Planotetraspora mira]